jgi:hypothetical protein
VNVENTEREDDVLALLVSLVDAQLMAERLAATSSEYEVLARVVHYAADMAEIAFPAEAA